MSGERSSAPKAEDWDKLYQHCRNLLQHKRTQSSAFSSREINDIDARLRVLEQRIFGMDTQPAEVVRRRTMVDNLRKQLNTVAQAKQAEEAELLDGVESGVKQLLHKTQGLHSEAKEQTALLMEMEKDMEGASEGLRREALHAEQVRKKKRKFWLYICIIIEILVLFLLVSYGLS